MSLSSEGDDVFNQQGYLEVEVNAEETGSPTTPAPVGAAADGVSRPERQQQGRRGLMRGTKRDCSRCQEANWDVFKQGGRRLEACRHCKQMSWFEPHTIT